MNTYRIFFLSGNYRDIKAHHASYESETIGHKDVIFLELFNENDIVIAHFNTNNIAGDEVVIKEIKE